MKFRTWLEEQSLQLPPIPGNFVRLTHFTSKQTAQSLLSGQNFSYKKQGMLSSTADAFSDNNEVLQLIQSGKTGAFSRKEFGDHVVLMDLPNTDNRIHSNVTMAPGEVSNERILGIVDTNTMQFTPNPKYNANAKPLDVPQTRGGLDRFTGQSVRQNPAFAAFATPMPAQNPATSNVDIW